MARLLRRVLYPEYLFNRKVRMTRPGFAYVGVLILVTAAAFNTQNNMLYLVLGMMLAALIFSFTVSEWAIARLKVRREAPELVEVGRVFSIAYDIRNEKAIIPSLAVRVTDRLEGAVAMASTPWIAGGSETRIRGATTVTRRGRVKFTDMSLSTSAPFGWFNKEKRVPLGGELIALPGSEADASLRERLESLGEERPRAKPGRGEELFGFRDYRRGDPVREIHWKTTARIGELMVREREAEEERRARIELKLGPLRPAVDDPARERAIEAAASLARAALADGWWARVEAGGRGVDFGHGPGHLVRILIFLALFDDPEKPAGELLEPCEARSIILP